MFFNVAAMLNGDSVPKQGKKYHPQLYVLEYKYIDDVENKKCSKLITSDHDGSFEA